MPKKQSRQPKAFLACYLVLIRKGRILLLKRANTGYQDGKYSMIAGHLEGKETALEALVREAQEESGLILDPKGLKIIHIMHRQDIDREYIDFFIVSDTVDEPRNLEPEKCEELRWFALDKLPKATIPYIYSAIESIIKGEPYSEYRASSLA